MASIGEVAEALAGRLAAISGLTVTDYVPATIAAPAAFVSLVRSPKTPLVTRRCESRLTWSSCFLATRHGLVPGRGTSSRHRLM